ncbi:MAG: CocE/NonD family hydrolase, partial [Ktedonobacterales bacterium]
MKRLDRVRALTLLACVLATPWMFVQSAAAQTPTLPSETPPKFTPAVSSFDYVRRDVMIPMRDGVKLHTVILVPKGAHRAPILLTRTPYDATATTSYAQSAHLAPMLNGYDNALDVIIPGGYIRVVEDIRGKYGSEGDYVMNRPLIGPLNPTKVDESTDTYDTIDWLIKHIPETNGKVGELGISYDGFEPLMALVNPHPALQVSVPMNPMVDGWMGDDWFHYGAFRQNNLDYISSESSVRGDGQDSPREVYDDYDGFLRAGSVDGWAKAHGLE